MSGKGYGRASGAGTVINAIATYKGSAFGIPIWTHAEVELGTDFKGIEADITLDDELGEANNADTRLIKRCMELVLAKYDLPPRGYVRTRSEIPVGSGLKSSSAAANATVIATLDAIGEVMDVLDAIRIGVKAALDTGVSITGAFDDACASMLGGVVITDNRANELIKRVEKDSDVLVFIPEAKAFTADTDVNRSRLIAPWVNIAFELALEERFEEAMTLNGFLYCAALKFNPEPMLRALECNARGVTLSGTGPSFVALVDGNTASLYEVWSDMGGRVLRTKINNETSFKYHYESR